MFGVCVELGLPAEAQAPRRKLLQRVDAALRLAATTRLPAIAFDRALTAAGSSASIRTASW